MSTARAIGLVICGLMILLCGWITLSGFFHVSDYWEVQRYHAAQFPVDLSVRQTFSGAFHSRYYGFADQLRIELNPPIKSESEMQSLLKPLMLRLRIQQSDGGVCFDQVIQCEHFNDEGIALLPSGGDESLAGCEGTYGLEPLTPYINVIVPGPVPSEYSLSLEVLEPSPNLAGRKQTLSCYTVYCQTEIGLGILIGEGIFIVGLIGLVGTIVISLVLLFRGQRIQQSIQSLLIDTELNSPTTQTDTGLEAENKTKVD